MMYEVLIQLDKIADMTAVGSGRLVGGWVDWLKLDLIKIARLVTRLARGPGGEIVVP